MMLFLMMGSCIVCPAGDRLAKATKFHLKILQQQQLVE